MSAGRPTFLRRWLSETISTSWETRHHDLLERQDRRVAWQQRLPARGDYFASPLAADGKIYALNEDGEVTVVAAKPVFEVLSVNEMGERAMASPAVSDGQIHPHRQHAVSAAATSVIMKRPIVVKAADR